MFIFCKFSGKEIFLIQSGSYQNDDLHLSFETHCNSKIDISTISLLRQKGCTLNFITTINGKVDFAVLLNCKSCIFAPNGCKNTTFKM